MSEILPTIKVKHKKYGIEMIINESDFDKEIHELLDKKARTAAKAAEEEAKKKANEAETAKAAEEEAKLKALMGEK